MTEASPSGAEEVSWVLVALEPGSSTFPPSGSVKPRSGKASGTKPQKHLLLENGAAAYFLG